MSKALFALMTECHLCHELLLGAPPSERFLSQPFRPGVELRGRQHQGTQLGVGAGNGLKVPQIDTDIHLPACAPPVGVHVAKQVDGAVKNPVPGDPHELGSR